MGVFERSVWGLAGLLVGLLGWWVLLRLSRRQGALSMVPVLLGLGLLIRLVVAVGTPDYYAPDEQAHFNYVKYLAEQQSFPVQTHKADSPSHDWEYYQPPLYYLAQLPIYKASLAWSAGAHATVVAMRLFSVLLWGIGAWLTLRFLRAMRIDDDVLQLTVISMVCLLPTYVFMTSAINNDNMVLCLGAMLMLGMSQERLTWRAAIGMGLLLGLAALAKFSAVVYGVALVGLVICRQAMGGGQWLKALRYLVIVGALALLVLSPWVARNLAVYGSATAEAAGNALFDWDALWRHPAVTAVITFTPEHPWLRLCLIVPVLLLEMFLTFWAISGFHNNVHFIFPFIGPVLAFVALRSFWRLWRSARSSSLFEGGLDKPYLVAMMVAIGVNMALVMRFGLLYFQPQGRFLFPMLVPLALLMGLGVRQWHKRDSAAHLAGFFLAYSCSFVGYSLATFPRAA